MSKSGSRNFVVLAILAAVFGGLAIFVFRGAPAFPGLSGPVQTTELPISEPDRTTIDGFQSNGLDSIAILLKDEDSSWLGLALGLKSIGVPFRVLTSTDQALQHDVVLVYPMLTGANTVPEDLQRLAEHVRSGKTLIAFSVIGGGMPDLFGFEATTERNNLDVIDFQPSPFTDTFIIDEAEKSISLKSFTSSDPGLPGVSYSNLKHPAIASYGDGSGAIVQNFFDTDEGTGHAYAVGLDIGHYILRAYNGRFTDYAETYVNAYQPKLDTFLRFLQQAYIQGEADAVSLYSTPFNKRFTALVTHDVDYSRSITNALAYAEYENSQDIPATYFIQTKYIADYNDEAFFDVTKIELLKEIESLGMEVGSHSVAHSNEFESMPLGTGTESYPGYEPFVVNFETVRNASISGELRVSKFLLESIADSDVVSFRPGHLSFPQALSQMLQANGYRFSSSITANSALTHLPYRMTFNRDYAAQSDVFEIPVTIEDEAGRLGSRVGEAFELADSIGRHGGVVNLLIHTDVLDHKLEFERRFIERYRNDAWFSTVRDFGEWWVVRDSASLQVDNLGSMQRKVSIAINGSIDGLTLQVPANWEFVQGPLGSSQQDNRLIVGEFSETAEIVFDVVAGM